MAILRLRMYNLSPSKIPPILFFRALLFEIQPPTSPRRTMPAPSHIRACHKLDCPVIRVRRSTSIPYWPWGRHRGRYQAQARQKLAAEQTFGLYISNFLIHHHFPKLWRLHLTANIKTSTCDHLKLHATALITLALATESPVLTTPQLLSILASYPMLQDFSLQKTAILYDTNDGSAHRVSLPCLI